MSKAVVIKRPVGYTKLWDDGNMEICRDGKRVNINLREFVKVANLPISHFEEEWKSFFEALRRGLLVKEQRERRG